MAATPVPPTTALCSGAGPTPPAPQEPTDTGTAGDGVDNDALRRRLERASVGLETSARGEQWGLMLAQLRALQPYLDEWFDEALEDERAVPLACIATFTLLVDTVAAAIERARLGPDQNDHLVLLGQALMQIRELRSQVDRYRETHKTSVGSPTPEVSLWDLWDDDLCDEIEYDCDDVIYDRCDDDDEEDENRMLLPISQPTKKDDDSGFLVASAEDTYGSSSVWLDAELQQLRLDVADAFVIDELWCSSDNNSTYRYECTYRGEKVTVQILDGGARTIENATAMAMTCKMFQPLKHPNLVPLIGLAWHKAVDIQIVTPYAPRADLRSLLDSSEAASLTWGEFKCPVAIDVASALACLHAHNLSAGLGGVTSHHVVLSGEEVSTTALLDLLQLPCHDVDAAQDRVPSPVRWLAPEVIRGEGSSALSDIYALGVILTELDTTKLPFHDAVSPNGAPMEDMLIAMHVSKGELQPEVSNECPVEIETLVARCLSYDPSQRPSAEQVVYEMRAIQKDL